MRINHHRLRALVESVLLEGFKDDQRYLTEKYPDHAQDLESLPPKWISWLTARFGERPKTEEIHPFEDAIVTIKSFSKRDAGLSAKYAAPGTEERPNVFKASVDEAFPPEDRSWKSPADATTMTVDEMEEILGLSERKKERFKTEVSEDDVESDRIGKVGPWNLWMPTTRERSCEIAGYDPVTRKPKTTWCTARMSDSNLFYNYVGDIGTDMTLFYIIRDNPKQDQDWLSVGFENGKPKLNAKYGGISVNRANAGLSPQKLMDALGSDYDEIMRVLNEKNKRLEGKHPARQKIKDAAQSVAALEYLTKGLSKEEASELKKNIFGEKDIASDVLAKLASDANDEIRSQVARNKNTPAEVLLLLTGDKSDDVRVATVFNKNVTSEVLGKLADDKVSDVRSAIARNKNTSTEVLLRLASDESKYVRAAVAENKLTETEILLQLANDEDWLVRSSVATNSESPLSILAKLAGDSNPVIRIAIAQNKRTPLEALQQLADDENSNVLTAVAASPLNSPKIRRQFSTHINKYVRATLARNKLTEPEILMQLASDNEGLVRLQVATRKSLPPEALEQLAGDPKVDVRLLVAGHPLTPLEPLKKLARDRSSTVRNAAKENLAKRQQLNERRLRQLIRQML